MRESPPRSASTGAPCRRSNTVHRTPVTQDRSPHGSLQRTGHQEPILAATALSYRELDRRHITRCSTTHRTSTPSTPSPPPVRWGWHGTATTAPRNTGELRREAGIRAPVDRLSDQAGAGRQAHRLPPARRRWPIQQTHVMSSPGPDPAETTGLEDGNSVPPGETPPGEASTSSAHYQEPTAAHPGMSVAPMVVLGVAGMRTTSFSGRSTTDLRCRRGRSAPAGGSGDRSSCGHRFSSGPLVNTPAGRLSCFCTTNG